MTWEQGRSPVGCSPLTTPSKPNGDRLKLGKNKWCSSRGLHPTDVNP